MTQKIKREDLKKKMDRGEDFVLIDVLKTEVYEKSHIKGAVNIPLARIGREARDRFEPDREIILYCADFDCPASAQAAGKLESLGFSNVWDYEGGKKDWQDAGYPMA
jgi:rhodanese-related sulfurtransferase